MTLALIAGQGGLPPYLARTLLDGGKVPVICEMAPFRSEIGGDLPRLSFRIETLGSFLAILHEVGVTHVCMAGAMQRPRIDPDMIDAATAPLIGRLQAAMTRGDDGTLREIIAIFEEAGFEVVGAVDIAPDLLLSAGCHTLVCPGDLTAELATARAVLQDMATRDLGQALVVRGRSVLAREDDRGTDAMLQDLTPAVPDFGMPDDWGDWVAVADTMVTRLLGTRSREDAPEFPAEGGVLFKAPKPGQEMRADMPLIGPRTAINAAAAGLAGIVIEARGVMVLNPTAVLQILDGQGMFLSAVAP